MITCLINRMARYYNLYLGPSRYGVANFRFRVTFDYHNSDHVKTLFLDLIGRMSDVHINRRECQNNISNNEAFHALRRAVLSAENQSQVLGILEGSVLA